MRELEVIATMILFGFLWSVIPWEPLTGFETFVAAVSVLTLSAAVVEAVKG
jgi:hypothetical protein